MTPVYAIIEETNIKTLGDLVSLRLSVEVMEVHLRRVQFSDHSYCKASVFYINKGEVFKEALQIKVSENEFFSLLSSIKESSGKNIDQYSMFFNI